MFKEFPRVDVLGKVTGEAKYAEDMVFPAMIYGAMVRSVIPHGRIVAIDPAAALEREDVLAVLTAKDIPGITAQPRQRPVLAEAFVRFHGDGVALVVATSQKGAREAARLVRVSYEELPAVFDVEEAVREGAYPIHGESNLEKVISLRHGNPESGFAQADLMVEREVSTQRVQHVAIEPEAAVGVPDSNGITVYCPSKSPFNVRKVIGETLDLPINKVRLISSTVGGSFGGKDYDMSVLGSRVALVARLFNRPCQMAYTREESIIEGTKRHPYKIRYKAGVRKDGKLTALKIDVLSDAGSYLSKSALVGWRSAIEAGGPYNIPHIWTDLSVIYTNQVYTDALRGFGSPQVDFGSEVLMDVLAEELGMDPLEIRRVNMLRDGDTHATGQVLSGVTISQCLDEMEAAVDYARTQEEIQAFNRNSEKTRKVRGMGISALHRGEALGAGGEGIDTAGANVHVEKDGSVTIYAGLSEVGQGCQTVMVRIVSEMLGISPSRCQVSVVDTDYVPDSGPTVASRGTVLAGNAVVDAVNQIKAKLTEALAQELWFKPSSEMVFENETIFMKDSPHKKVTFDQAVGLVYGQSRNLYGNGWWAAPKLVWNWETGQGDAYFNYVYGACAAVVEVDLDTGKVDVLRFIATHDIGTALNREEVYGQICGGVAMGIGYALTEEVSLKNGRITNPNFDAYLIPTALDVGQIEPVILEDYSAIGPLGAKGLGEPVTSIVAPAIANAVSQAIGRRVYRLPADLEQVLALIGEEKK